MSYATEQVAEALKAARQQKGLSQRALSKLSGVPQAHISKIEGNAVDLRLSSLIALAHALDLELTLVPRNALPAVQSLSRTAGRGFAAPAVSKDLARAIQAASRAREKLTSPELERLRTMLSEISRFPLPNLDPAIMHDIRKAVESIGATSSAKALQNVLKTTASLRNALVHNAELSASEPIRPAYQLEEDGDG